MTYHLPKTLGIDFGTRRIGIALSYGTLAEPLTIIEVSPKDHPNFLVSISNISQLISQHQVQQLVLGISENQMAKKTQEFGQLLQKTTKLPLFYQDETLSSYQVGELMKNRSLTQRRLYRDDKAAALILQDWLDDQIRLHHTA